MKGKCPKIQRVNPFSLSMRIDIPNSNNLLHIISSQNNFIHKGKSVSHINCNNINDNKDNLSRNNSINSNSPCNCGTNKACFLKRNCRITNTAYRCKITAVSKEFFHVGLASMELKQHIVYHLSAFKYIYKRQSTDLNKLIWHFKDFNKQSSLDWKILSTSFPYDKTKSFYALCKD